MVGDVESGAKLVVVVDATEETIEPKVRVSNRKAMVYCDLHRKLSNINVGVIKFLWQDGGYK